MNQEPLGTLLLRRGLITNEQLTKALADQQATGEPLGQIVVARGYVTPAMVGQALATQHGGLLKTEYGFATGFGSGTPPAAVVEEPPVSAKAPSAPATVAVAEVGEHAPVADPKADREAVRAELAMAAAEAEKLRDDNARLAELRSKLEQRLATESQRAASLERELAAAKEQHSPEGDLELQLAHATRRVAELLAARDDALSQLRDAKGVLAKRDAVVHELTVWRDNALETLRAREAEIAELVAARDEAIVLSRTMSTDPWAAAERHLLFFQGPDGYELVERDGPPPATGAQLLLGSGVHVVARVAASPAPGQRVPCAYLVAA